MSIQCNYRLSQKGTYKDSNLVQVLYFDKGFLKFVGSSFTVMNKLKAENANKIKNMFDSPVQVKN